MTARASVIKRTGPTKGLSLTVSKHRDLPCADDPELFFPLSETGASETQIDAAKAVCGQCPVRMACLDLSLRNGEPYGIWGGVTAKERRVMLSGRRTPELELPEPEQPDVDGAFVRNVSPAAKTDWSAGWLSGVVIVGMICGCGSPLVESWRPC